MEKIFYSWQADLPPSINRSFIEKALENAAKAIRADGSVNVEPVIDRDSKGVPGSPDVSEEIFRKIDQAAVFVCDVSIIGSIQVEGGKTKHIPNPNILIELGYAIKVLGWKRIVLVMNTVFGDPTSLPFDLLKRRVDTYSLDKSVQEKASERKKLQSILEQRLRDVFDGFDLFLPGLGKIECSLFKRICQALDELGQPSLPKSKVVELDFDSNLETLQDSLRLLEQSDCIRVARGWGGDFVSITVTPFGYELYAKAHFPGYNKILEIVASLVLKRGAIESNQLAREVGTSHAIIRLISEILASDSWVRLSEPSNGGAPVGQTVFIYPEPKLKRSLP